ncbi:hypothetical protein V8J82_23620 [Gymnodinialimonas sp. 2305UL16-5]|uniref:hypothetical protein n=1 Tax=Gymnodinialimonas mytili TaxID=3126503 RepID=UPI0030A5C056
MTRQIAGKDFLKGIMLASYMLQVWKIDIPSPQLGQTSSYAWVLANSAKEAIELSGCDNAIATEEPERLWIAKEKVIWMR